MIFDFMKLRTSKDGLVMSLTDSRSEPSVKSLVFDFGNELKSVNSEDKSVGGRTFGPDKVNFNDVKEDMAVNSDVIENLVNDNNCHLSSIFANDRLVEPDSSGFEDPNYDVLLAGSQDLDKRSRDQILNYSIDNVHQFKGAIPKRKLILKEEVKVEFKGTQSRKKILTEKKEIDRSQSIEIEENIPVKEKLVMKEKKKIEVDEYSSINVAESLKSKEDYVLDNIPKLQYRGERKKEIVDEIVDENIKEKKENTNLMKMRKKESNWLELLSEKEKKKAELKDNPKKTPIGRKICTNRKKDSNRKKEKLNSSLTKNMKIAKEISTPRKKMNTIEKLFSNSKKENKQKENSIDVKKIVEKFENSGALIKNTDEKESQPPIRPSQLSNVKCHKRLEHGRQTKEKKGALQKETGL